MESILFDKRVCNMDALPAVTEFCVTQL